MRIAAALGPILALALSGCAMSDEQIARFVAVSDKYMFYSCEEIATEVKKNSERERELQQLMAKAQAGSGGQLVANVAYGTDYTRVRGNLMELRAATAEKHCAPSAAAPAPSAGSDARR